MRPRFPTEGGAAPAVDPRRIDTESSPEVELATTKVRPPLFQVPDTTCIPINIVQGPTFVNLSAGTPGTPMAELLRFNVNPGDQLRISHLALQVDEVGCYGLVTFTLSKNGAPLRGFNNLYPMGWVYDPFPVALNIAGPAVFTIGATNQATNNATIGSNQSLDATVRIVGWLWEEVVDQ